MSVVTLSVNNSTRGVVAGGGTYDNGTQITVTAMANSGSLFACWSIGEMVVSSNPSYTFSVSGNVTLKAHFYSEIDGVAVYGLCGANCKHRVLNIGQVISLIQEMAANGWQVPTGYIPKTAVNSIVEQSTGKELKLFINTQSEWNKYTGDKTTTLFIPTDDTTLNDIIETLTKINDRVTVVEDFKNDLYVHTLKISSWINCTVVCLGNYPLSEITDGKFALVDVIKAYGGDGLYPANGIRETTEAIYIAQGLSVNANDVLQYHYLCIRKDMGSCFVGQTELPVSGTIIVDTFDLY